MAPGWSTLHLPASYQPGNGCSCGSSKNCHEKDLQLGLERLGDSGPSRLLIKLRHEKYSLAQELQREMRTLGFPEVRCEMTVRPARARLVSVFTDYWTQVGKAKSPFHRDKFRSRHRARVLTQYRQDSKHYLKDGTIDGHGFFLAFEEHGPGIPFFLSEIFDSPTQFENALSDRDIFPVPTRNLDLHLSRLAGEDRVMSNRVSQTPSPAVTEALRDAHDIIERLASRDDAFDKLLDSRVTGYLKT